MEEHYCSVHYHNDNQPHQNGQWKGFYKEVSNQNSRRTEYGIGQSCNQVDLVFPDELRSITYAISSEQPPIMIGKSA